MFPRLLVTLLSLIATTAAAQAPSITVLAHVTDANKQSVADIAPADLELKIAGRVQRIVNVRPATSCAVLVLFDMPLAPAYPLLTTLGALPAANNATKLFRPAILAYNAAQREVAPGETAASKAVHAFFTGPLSQIENAWEAVEAAAEKLVPKAACGSIVLIPNRGPVGDNDHGARVVARLLERRFSFHMVIGDTMQTTALPTRPGLDGQGGSNPLRPTHQPLNTGPITAATEQTGGSQVRIDQIGMLSPAVADMVRDLEARVLLDVAVDEVPSGSRDLDLRALRQGLRVRAPKKLRVP